MENNINAYRAIFKSDVEAYKTNPAVIADLDGAHFISLGNSLNNHTYDPQKQYLHFFIDKDTALSYAKSLQEGTLRETTVAMFSFPPEILENYMFVGRYQTNIPNHFVDKDELIIPIELYDANLHFVGLVPENELKKPNYDPDSYAYGWF